jgi:hypothetical protein
MSVIGLSTPLGQCKFSPNWHEQLVAAPLRVSPTDHGATREAIAALLGELSRDTHPFDIGTEVAQRAAGQMSDAEHWTVSLGDDDDNRSAGIVRSDPLHGGDGSFWVVARTGGGAPARNLHTFVLSHPTMTVGELLQAPEYTVARDYASRNARRIGALIAGALTTGPLSAVVAAERDPTAVSHDGAAPPALLVPTVHHSFNAFSTRGLPAGSKPGSVLYLGSEACGALVGSHVLVAQGADCGFLLQPVGSDRGNVPLEPIEQHDVQQTNTRFWTRLQTSPAAHKQHVYTHFLTRVGEPLSSAARPLWRESPIGGGISAPGTQRLTPYVLVVAGKPARSMGGGGN